MTGFGPQTVHHIFRASLILATLAVLTAGRTQAAPVFVTGEEAERYLAMEESVTSVSAPVSPPNKNDEPPLNSQNDAIPSTAGSSTGGSPVSAQPVGGVSAAANLTTATHLQATQAGSHVRKSDWLHIPPRFLDGVFRPPRHIVSL